MVSLDREKNLSRYMSPLGVLTLVIVVCALLLGESSWGDNASTTSQEAANLDRLLDIPKGEEAGNSNHERLPYHLGSIASLVVILLSLTTAMLLNSRTAGRRILGTSLAAVFCLAVALIIAWLASLGTFSNTRAHLLPTDSLKPGMMIFMGLLFSGSGLLLGFIAYSQAQARETMDSLQLGLRNEVESYGQVSRILHWTTAILFILLFPMGVYTSMIPEDVWYRQGYYVAHKTIGFTLLGLVILRLIWHRFSPKPGQDNHLKSWEKKSAHAAHILLYVLMIGFPISGYVLSTYAGKLSHFFIWDTPMLFDANREMLMPFLLTHKVVLPVVFYVVFFAHVAGVIKHRYIDRSVRTLRRMVG